MALPRVLDGLRTATPGLTLIPVVGAELSTAVDVVVKMSEMLGAFTEGEKEGRLVEDVARMLESVISQVKQTNSQISHDRKHEIQELCGVLNDILSEMECKKEQRMSKKSWDKDDNDDTERLRRRLVDVVSRFNASVHIQMMNEVKKLQEETNHAIVSTYTSIIVPQDASGDRGLILELRPVYEARYDYGEARQSCLENTRVQVLTRIHNWIDDESGESVYWLVGMAGTGKTTVAYTVCEKLATEKNSKLGASFFFSRDQAERRDPENVVRTIAFQLAQVSPQLRKLLVLALKENTDIVTSSMQDQMRVLIAEPLSRATEIPSPLVLVIDALDECLQDGGNFIYLLSYTIRKLLPAVKIKVLVTSRNEARIRAKFDSVLHQSYKLHDVDGEVVDADIRAYFVHHFKKISRQYKLGETWPSEEDVMALVERAGRLFIFAATLINYLDVDEQPSARLQTLIASPTASSWDDRYQQLDQLYLQVLRSAIEPKIYMNTKRPWYLQRVAGTISLLQDRLPKEAFVRLLNVDLIQTRSALYGLSAVVIIPENTSSDSADGIRVAHPSFPDFITDPKRCADIRFYINRATHHALVAHRCLDILVVDLQHDVCNIKDPSLLNTDISDLATRIQTYINPEVAFACRFWLENVLLAAKDAPELNRALNAFCNKRIPEWIEACSLLGILPDVMAGLRKMHTWFQLAPQLSEAYCLLRDAERLIMNFYASISSSALHIHYSAIPFIPDCILLSKVHDQPRCAPRLTTPRLIDWSPVLQVLEGHYLPVESLIASSDGTLIASASAGTICIWDPWAGKKILTLNAPSRHPISSLAFSQDGMRIFATYNQAIHVWDTTTGVYITGFPRHNHALLYISISPDGTQIISGCGDCAIYIRDLKTGDLVAKLSGHTSAVTSTVYTLDGSKIISGSLDCSIRVWNPVTGVAQRIINGHTAVIESLTFTKDGNTIFSASGDRTLRSWNTNSGRQIGLFTGHMESVTSVALTEDENFIVSGSRDKTIRIWNIATGECRRLLEDHTDYVQSVLVLPGDTRICSASRDRTIRLWDMHEDRHGAVEVPLSVPSEARQGKRDRFKARMRNALHDVRDAIRRPSVSSLSPTRSIENIEMLLTAYAISPDGSFFAFGMEDGTIQILNAVTNAKVQTLGIAAPHSYTTALTFSLDGAWLTAAVHGHIVRLWNVAGGVCHAEWDRAHDAVMLPDNSKIVVVQGINDNKFIEIHRIGNYPMGDMRDVDPLHRLHGYIAPIHHVYVSPDGSRFLSQDLNGQVRIWDVETAACIVSLDEHRMAHAFAFSEDGSRVVSFSWEGSRNVWGHSAIDTPPELSVDPKIYSALFFVDNAGWLWGPLLLGGPCKRLCWLPLERRWKSPCFFKNGMVTIVSKKGLITNVDVSDVINELRGLDRVRIDDVVANTS